MARTYEVGVRGVAAAAAAPYASFHAGGTNRVKIREIGFFLSAATATSIGLGRPANSPVATTSSLGQARDPAEPAATANADTAWSTAPTAPTIFMRRAALPATQGAGLIWTWPPDAPFVLAAGAFLVFWNFGGAAGAAPDIYVCYEE